jgi:acetylornithine deacetylase/succinyl-diaminopimelate desuccinylase-like protein
MGYGLVEQRRRQAARIALYGSLLLVGLGTLLTHRYFQLPLGRGADTDWHGVAWADHPAVRLLQQLIRIDTSPAGDELAAALYLATPLEAAGIPVFVERLGERQANLWAILEGDEPGALVLLNHLDVEPAATEVPWQHPPFAGVVEPPWIHGRGAFDMKSYTVAQLVALLELRARHPRPRRSVIFLATSGEEHGSDLGVRWILRERPELVARFWAVLTEGGVVEARNLESLKYWGTEVGQRRYPRLVACAPSRERLEQLAADIRDFASPAIGLAVDPEVRRFWQVYRPSRDLEELRDLLADPDALVQDPARFLALPSYLQGMLRNDLSVGVPEPAAGGGWEMPLVFHLLPAADYGAVRAERLPPWLLAGVTVVETAAAPPAAISPVDHPVMQAIDAALAAQLGKPLSGPFFLPATATDSRFLRPLDIPSYGFSPFLILSTDTLRAGLPNERIGAPGFAQGVALYTEVVARVAMADK